MGTSTIQQRNATTTGNNTPPGNEVSINLHNGVRLFGPDYGTILREARTLTSTGSVSHHKKRGRPNNASIPMPTPGESGDTEQHPADIQGKTTRKPMSAAARANMRRAAKARAAARKREAEAKPAAQAAGATR